MSSGTPSGNAAQESSGSRDAGSSPQFGLYVSVFLESMVLYNSNRVPVELRRGVAVPTEEEVPQARLHQLALGVAFGSIVEGCMSTHGPPRQMLVERLKPTGANCSTATPANSGSASPISTAVSGGYRITQTAGFVVNISPSPESNTGKQALVGLVLTVRQLKDVAALLRYPRWLRHFLNLAVDLASAVTMAFFEQHLKGVPAKTAVAAMHQSGAHAAAFVAMHGVVAAVLRCAAPASAVASLRATRVKGGGKYEESGDDVTAEACAVPPLSGSLFSRSAELHKGMRCPRLVLPYLSLSGFQRVVDAATAARLLVSNQTTVASPRAAQARRAHTNSSGSGAAANLDEIGTDVAGLFRTAVSDLLTFNSSFTSAFVAGVLSISASLVLHPHDGTGYRQYWHQVEEETKKLRAMRGSTPGRGGGGSRQPEPLLHESSPPVTERTREDGSTDSDVESQHGPLRASPQASGTRHQTSLSPGPTATTIVASADADAARALTVGDRCAEAGDPLHFDLPPHRGVVAQSYVEGGPVARASAAVDARPLPLVRDEGIACSAPLNAKSLAAAAEAAERLASTMPEPFSSSTTLSHSAHEQALVPFLPSARVVIFSSDPELARKTMLLASFFLRIPEVDGAEQEAELLRLSGQLVGAGANHESHAAQRQPRSPTHHDSLLLSSFSPVSAPCCDLDAPTLPISWVPEEFNPKTHIDVLVHQKCAPENLILIVSPRAMLVRRLHLRKRFSTQGLQMERRLHGITKMWPFVGSDGTSGSCFSSQVAGDVLVHHNQFLVKALQRSLAVELRTKGVIHPAMYLEEMLSIVGVQAELYRALVAHTWNGAGTQPSVLDVAEALLNGDNTVLSRSAQLSVGWPTNKGKSIASSSNVEVVSQSSRSHGDGKSGSPILSKPPFGAQCESVKQFNADLQQALGNEDVDVSHVQLLTFLAGDDLCCRR